MLKEELVAQATEILLKEIPKYITIKEGAAFNKFQNNKYTLEQLGICNGVATLIDIKLQKLHPEICVLQTDTLEKFQSDIIKCIDREFVPKKIDTKKNRMVRFRKL